jgi:hypothetical protein
MSRAPSGSWSVGGIARRVRPRDRRGRIVEVDLIADADHLARIDLEPVPA